jgi:hypothetical protein
MKSSVSKVKKRLLRILHLPDKKNNGKLSRNGIYLLPDVIILSTSNNFEKFF